MAAISSTRSELLARRSQLKLSRQGRELLEQKRAALMAEFLREANKLLQQEETLQRIAARANAALARANAMAGAEAVLSAALASRADSALEITREQVMGVEVLTFAKQETGSAELKRRRTPARVSLSIDEASAAFEAEVSGILWLAESELRLRRLINEIQRTARRFNALDMILIPRLEKEQAYIQATLNERERADHYRIKLVKRAQKRKR
jgi:V/A-type H+-transporting ATPase subunit D